MDDTEVALDGGLVIPLVKDLLIPEPDSVRYGEGEDDETD